jgi:glutamine synthetase
LKERQILVDQVKVLLDFIKSKFGADVKIGAELEFYLRADSTKTINEILDQIPSAGCRLEKEKGWNQYEFVFSHEEPVLALLERINQTKSFIRTISRQKDCNAIFDAKPYPDDYGSSLHLHISLHDKFGLNMFATEATAKTVLGRAIAGILDISEESIYLMCKSPEEYLRFSPKFLSPTNVSWGANNRTTLIRIPTSSLDAKRIEFRLPSSVTEPAMAVYVALIGVIHGLSKELNLPPQIYGNAFDAIYELPPLPQSLQEAKNIFEKKATILHYSRMLIPKFFEVYFS